MEMIKELSKICDVCDKAIMYANDISAIIEIMKVSNSPLRCKDIAPIMKERGYNSSISHITKMLGFARELGLVVRTEIDGNPVEVDYEEYKTIYDDGKPETVTIDGVIYRRINDYNRKGELIIVKKTIIPKIAMYSLV